MYIAEGGGGKKGASGREEEANPSESSGSGAATHRWTIKSSKLFIMHMAHIRKIVSIRFLPRPKLISDPNGREERQGFNVRHGPADDGQRTVERTDGQTVGTADREADLDTNSNSEQAKKWVVLGTWGLVKELHAKTNAETN
ncbi:uncharacterized protein LOC27207861 [Drosophila simulans]|uniref:uncharacterized protein LOC27207861 n=1 Tax=Drosophila simulans TaxID=7240 RepID=UPI00078AF2B2|nr:uncharacterized protein LOC27207861 [Drosophila simulans]KMZ04214.1 uncharacterized protein Dsimw501_GD28012, isoform B [Drosophila simulans]